jgi:hypothetical protein
MLPRGPSDLPDGPFLQRAVKPHLKKYFCFTESKSSLYSQPSRPTKGALRNVINAGRDAVDADGASDEGA